MVDVLPDISPGNNIPERTDWVKKVEKYNNVSITISVKLDVDGFLYHNIPLKDVTNVGIVNRMYSKPQKNRNFCDSIIK